MIPLSTRSATTASQEATRAIARRLDPVLALAAACRETWACPTVRWLPSPSGDVVPSQEHPPVHFVRIDLRFSGSFIDMDAGDLTGVLEDASTMTFAFDDDELLDDLADALDELGQGADALTIVDVAGDGFHPPATLDVEATTTSGWPRFATGARFTRFLALGAPAEESALRAVREAYSMATVRVQGPGVVAHDESPTVTVNAVTDPEATLVAT